MSPPTDAATSKIFPSPGVDVRPVVEFLEIEIGVHIAVLVGVFVQTVDVLVTQGQKITHRFAPAGEADIGVGCRGEGAKHLVVPVYIWIELVVMFDRAVVPVLIGIELRLGVVWVPSAEIVADRFVVKGGIGVRVDELGQRYRFLPSLVETYFHLGFPDRTAFGRNPDHAVGSLYSELGQRSGVFEYGLGLDFRGGKTVHRGFEPIDVDQRLAGVPRTEAADIEYGGIVARFARRFVLRSVRGACRRVSGPHSIRIRRSLVALYGRNGGCHPEPAADAGRGRKATLKIVLFQRDGHLVRKAIEDLGHVPRHFDPQGGGVLDAEPSFVVRCRRLLPAVTMAPAIGKPDSSTTCPCAVRCA